MTRICQELPWRRTTETRVVGGRWLPLDDPRNEFGFIGEYTGSDANVLVPFVEDEHTVFLKTIIPSRKATKDYLGEEPDNENGR
jgi:hypothetical protein